MSRLIDPAYGCDGTALLIENLDVRMEDTEVLVLLEWISATSTSSLLWYSGPFELRHDSISRTAALYVIAISLRVKIPFISYFCETPQRKPHKDGLSLEKAGLLNLVYSLIHQLLQFDQNSNGVDQLEERVSRLGWNEESWPTSLSILNDLLHHARHIPCCVIHGIINVESGTSRWCQTLLHVLLRQQEKDDSPFSLLFTTSGLSRTLANAIPAQCRHDLTTPAPDVQKRGRYVNMYTE